MHTRHMFRRLLMFGSLVLMVGCAQQLPPVSVTGVVDGTPAITQEKDHITLTLQTQRWDFYPRDLARFFTPIHVAMHNDLDRPIVVTLDSFVLKDEQGIAHYTIAPEKLVRVFYRVGEQPTPRRTPMFPQSSALPGRSQRAIALMTGGPRNLVQQAIYRGEPFDVERVYHYGYYSYCYTPPPVYYDPQSPKVQNTPLMLFAFRDGVIPPHTHRTGYVFFQKAIEPGQRLTLYVHVQDAAHPHQGNPAEFSGGLRVPLTRR